MVININQWPVGTDILDLWDLPQIPPLKSDSKIVGGKKYMQNNPNMEWLNKRIIIFCMINICLDAPQQCF